MKAIGIHHDASSQGASADSAYQWSCHNSPDKPVGNGSLGRDGTFQLWAAGAANTMGKGGALRVARGTINLDDGNANMFAIEAGNNGVGEQWTDAQVRNYPLLCCAVLDWANHETPGPAMNIADIVSHWEYCQPSCPGRKIDPAGPSPWMLGQQTGPTPMSWNMDAFRDSVAKAYTPPKPIPPPEEDDMKIIYAFREYANTWSETGVHLSAEAYTAMVNAGATVVVSELTWPHNQHLDSLLNISGLGVEYLIPK
jgi:hypothetical protein